MERKKTNMILKILEDWLKNYQILSSLDSNEEKVLQSERDEICKKDAIILAQQKANAAGAQGITIAGKAPYDNDMFCGFMMDMFSYYLLQ